ncbi:MAG: class IIb bacteriocin, lactobin A/cerein 7B family [Clostridia bacterium]|nr:class IIb bacteriocin, lactobin A/cerein 7B family [Clostridia bacterium]
MNIKKIKEVFSDEVFVKSLFEMETVAEVQTALKEKGIEMTEDEILSVRDLIGKMGSGEINSDQLQNWSAQTETGELSEEELENVAGGLGLAAIVVSAIIIGIVGSGVGVGIGVTVASLIHKRW